MTAMQAIKRFERRNSVVVMDKKSVVSFINKRSAFLGEVELDFVDGSLVARKPFVTACFPVHDVLADFMREVAP